MRLKITGLSLLAFGTLALPALAAAADLFDTLARVSLFLNAVIGLFITLAIVKVIGMSLISGSLFSFIAVFSLMGTLTAALVMWASRRLGGGLISQIGVSILGALASNAVQVILARYIVFGQAAWLIAPLFLDKRVAELGSLEDIDRDLLRLELDLAIKRGKIGRDASAEARVAVMQRKANLGMNAILSVSLALGRLLAAREGWELPDLLKELESRIDRGRLYSLN